MSSTGLLEEVSDCERRVWDALVAGDRAADLTLLCAGFLGVYPDGFAGRADHADQLGRGPTVASYTLSELRALPVGADHALLAYRARYVRVGRSATEEMYVSSLWRRRRGSWVNIFSQDTPATGAAVP